MASNWLVINFVEISMPISISAGLKQIRTNAIKEIFMKKGISNKK
jgi:hypothetical protein